MIIQPEALKAAVALCHRSASATGNASPIACILLRADGDRLHLQATDYDMTASASIAREGNDALEVLIPARALAAVVGALPAVVSVEVTAAGGTDDRITIRAGSSVWHLSGIPAHEWPAVDVVDVPADAPSLPDLSAVECAVSTDESRPALNGVCIGGGVAVATDGHRLHTAPAVHDGEPVTLHRRALAALAALGTPLTFAVEDRQIGIAGPVGTLTVRRVEEAFPDWRRVMPDGTEHALTLDRSDLIAAIRRVSALGTGKHALLRLSAADGVCVLEMVDPELGDSRAELDCIDGDLRPVTCDAVGFNPRYLLDALNAVGTTGSEIVEIGLSDQFSPVLVRSPGSEVGSGVVLVVMPKRL